MRRNQRDLNISLYNRIEKVNMEKNYEIYKVGNSGNIEINKVKEKDLDGYITGATKELVETLLCEVKWEVKKLELEIKKVRL